MKASEFAGVVCAGLVLAVVGAGCAAGAAAGPSYAEAKLSETRGDAALVYVVRFHAEPVLWPATISVDGVEVAGLGQQGFTRFYVMPGRHEISSHWNLVSGQHSGTLAREFEAGKTYYVELVGTSRPGAGGVGSALMALSSEDAEPRLSLCKFQKPGPSWREP
jgi:hypothetical protein